MSQLTRAEPHSEVLMTSAIILNRVAVMYLDAIYSKRNS